jgi:hypothetical protein
MLDKRIVLEKPPYNLAQERDLDSAKVVLPLRKNVYLSASYRNFPRESVLNGARLRFLWIAESR